MGRIRQKYIIAAPLLQRLYHKVIAWSRHHYARYYLALVALTEAIIFPVPPDVMLAPMVHANPKRAWSLASLTTICSVMGGLVGYAIGFFAFESVGLPLMTYLHLESAYQTVTQWFNHYGFFAMLVAGITPVPYKVFTLAAGVSHMTLLPFLLSALIGRGIRFFAVAGLVRFFGEDKVLKKYLNCKVGFALCLCAAMLTLGCMPPPKSQAPVEVRTVGPVHHGTHTVRSGETLYSIAWRYDRNYKELAQINQLNSPYHLQAGQKIQLKQPSLKRKFTEKKTVVAKGPAPDKRLEKPPVAIKKLTVPVSKMTKLWQWPSAGHVIGKFSESGVVNKGIDIRHTHKSPVLAARAGQVVYAGNGLRGYGNLIIIKHSDDFLSAYAHNDTMLITEGAAVHQGQKIATMGWSEAKQPKLHFEIRYKGQPVDPMKYLPTILPAHQKTVLVGKP